jgi:Fe-S-cluster containining protein
MDFECVRDCSQCCIEREYYPSKKYGKIGVLILPKEIEKIESLARKHNMHVKILPRIGISDGDTGPEKIIAYQMMGIEENGNTCPFLDTASGQRSPHGGFLCKIYENRPIACRAYPLIETLPITLDAKCKFCQQCGTADGNLSGEAEALMVIKSSMPARAKKVWRYATGTGEIADKEEIMEGWICDP